MPRCTLCLAVALPVISGASGQTVSILAWDQTAYPTLPAGATLLFTAPQGPALAPDGGAVFTASLAGSATGLALCRSTPAGPAVIAHQGDPAPGSGGLNYDYFSRFVAMSGGRALFMGPLRNAGGATAAMAVYLSDPSGAQPLMLSGQPAPGAPGLVLETPISPVAAPGLGAFFAGIGPGSGPATSSGLWSGGIGTLGLLALLGEQAVGFSPGRTYTSFTTSAALNASGVALFRATVGPSATQDLVVYSGTPGALSIVYATGQPAPGVSGGVFCTGSGAPVTSAINAAGDAVFGASVCGPFATRRSMWLASGGTLTPVVFEGDPAPGTPGVEFASFAAGSTATTDPVLTDTRHIAFVANLTGPGVSPANNTAICAGSPLRLIVRKGDSAPGFPSGTTILNFNAGAAAGDVFAINARDQIVFPASVNNGGNPGVALYYADPAGRITRLLYPGGPISIAGGTGNETLSQFYLLPAISNGPSGRPAWLDDSGRVSLMVRVTRPLEPPRLAAAILQLPDPCYANCDLSTTPPILNVADFTCFLNRFASADPMANCDLSTTPPTLNIADFTCFLNAFAAGCP